MIRRITMLVGAALLVLSVAAPAVFAAKECTSAADPGCKDYSTPVVVSDEPSGNTNGNSQSHDEQTIIVQQNSINSNNPNKQTTAFCLYNGSGNLQESKSSDTGCPATNPNP